MEIREVTREEFVSFITDAKEDRFAKTFRAKCDMMDLWKECIGLFMENELCCAIVVTVSKREPKVANIQLIHTFFKHRGNGYASVLTNIVVSSLFGTFEYLRVSAEKDAVGFYEKIGFTFLGEQKSGCQLSICKMNSTKISDNVFDKSDPFIMKQLNRKGKGGCVKIF